MTKVIPTSHSATVALGASRPPPSYVAHGAERTAGYFDYKRVFYHRKALEIVRTYCGAVGWTMRIS